MTHNPTAQQSTRFIDLASETFSEMYRHFTMLAGAPEGTQDALGTLVKYVAKHGARDARYDAIGIAVRVWSTVIGFDDYSTHTVARAYVYTVHADKTMDEQTPIILSVLSDMSA